MAGLLGSIIGAAGGMSSGAAQGLAGILATKDARQWERHFRQTAWQDTLKDLRGANLNPNLAFSQGPNSGKSGVPPTQIPDFGAAVSEGIETGLSAAKQVSAMRDQLKTIQFTKEKAEADASRAWSEAEAAGGILASQKHLNMSTAERNFEDAKKAVSEQLWISQQERESRARTSLLDTELPRAKADQRFYESEFGEKTRTAQRILEIFPLLRGAMGRGAAR